MTPPAFASLGIEVRQLMSDNGSAYRSYPVATFLHQQVIEHCLANRYWPVCDSTANRPETRTAKPSPSTKHQPPNASQAAATGLRAKIPRP